MTRHPPTHPLLSDEIESAGGAIPLSWVRSSVGTPLGNFGDAASAVVVAAIAGRPVTHRAFNSKRRRIVAIGTIGQGQSAGAVHVWGTGFDPKRAPVEPRDAAFFAAPDVEYAIHATRGPYSRGVLLRAGIPAPDVYGDPAWFLPRILHPKPERRHELGVIMHISELETPSVTANPLSHLMRYRGGEAEGVHFISTYHQPTWQGFQDKLAELLSCKRIISRSLHGMLLADAYGIPCLYMSDGEPGMQRLDIEAGYGSVDHRFADAYRGFGRTRLAAFGLPKDQPSPWAEVMVAADQMWEPIAFSGKALFEAFPVRPAVSFDDGIWPFPTELAEALPW
ncbi:polysaccharide pyruvyl transferase family protein [Dankookia sp. GCM10030260]|uniref:polysaccharide pyruvyl transferase family protein n=1 Tax=Dankookia sp. GCM10030260 TaxID=3273390 RepID=UPI0036D2A8BE